MTMIRFTGSRSITVHHDHDQKLIGFIKFRNLHHRIIGVHEPQASCLSRLHYRGQPRSTCSNSTSPDHCRISGVDRLLFEELINSIIENGGASSCETWSLGRRQPEQTTEDGRPWSRLGVVGSLRLTISLATVCDAIYLECPEAISAHQLAGISQII